MENVEHIIISQQEKVQYKCPWRFYNSTYKIFGVCDSGKIKCTTMEPLRETECIQVQALDKKHVLATQKERPLIMHHRIEI
jgi:hypothetical protein